MCKCDCSLPEGAVLLNELRIVEYFSSDGEIWKIDLSHTNDGDDLVMGKALELAEWAKTLTVAPMIAEMVHSYMQEADEDDEDDDEDDE